MNKERRKVIGDINEKLSELAQQVCDLQEQEQDFYDKMPESFQQGDKGQVAEAAVSAFDEAYGAIQEAIDQLSQAAGE